MQPNRRSAARCPGLCVVWPCPGEKALQAAPERGATVGRAPIDPRGCPCSPTICKMVLESDTGYRHAGPKPRLWAWLVVISWERTGYNTVDRSLADSVVKHGMCILVGLTNYPRLVGN